MIDRFNFYDVYGNFLPGLAFLGLIWLPLGIIRGVWPGKEIMSAIAVLAFAYIVGHILQNVFQNALPSKGKDKKGRRRYPSDYFLDSDDTRFSQEFKSNLATVVEKLFKISLRVDAPISDGDQEKISRARQDAFRMARNMLLKSEADLYGEQFQGLYALMRGLAAAFWMGSAYTVGWCLYSLFNPYWIERIAIAGWIALAIAVSIGLLLVFWNLNSRVRMLLDRGTFGSLLVVLFASGVQLASRVSPSITQSLALMLVAAASFFSGARCFSSYRHFAEEFARATWNDFLSYQSSSSAKRVGSFRRILFLLPHVAMSERFSIRSIRTPRGH